MKIITVVGARPQFIKAACLSKVFIENESIEETIIHTGQHFDVNMSDVFFKDLNIPNPNYNLHVSGLSHGAMTGQMIEKIEKILILEKPDYVLVYGDTNSTLAGALAARKLNIPILHVEGGLRNFDLSIPEEVNRILTDRVSDVLFCSTDNAITNLHNEGFKDFPCEIVKTGDIMVDAVKLFSKVAYLKSSIIDKLSLIDNSYILCEFHRASNATSGNLEIIINSLTNIAARHKLIFLVHPRIKKALNANKIFPQFKMVEPVGYLDMLSLIEHSSMLITDSGGLQREAYIMKKNCLLLMDYTPWEELTDNGFSFTTAINNDDILRMFERTITATPDYSINLYGDGNTALDILNFINHYHQNVK